MSNSQQPKQESEQIVKVLQALAEAASGGIPPSDGLSSESMAQLVKLQAESGPEPVQEAPKCEPQPPRFSLAALFMRFRQLMARLFNRKD